VTRTAYLLVRAGDLLTKHETPIKEWFHSLSGLAVKVVDALAEWFML
jgi:hypothetical protein